MTLKQVLRQAREVLETNNVADAPLEGELLLRHVLGINRAQLYLNLEQELSAEQGKVFWHLVERRLGGEPAAYITGHREFYRLNFYVNPSVLIPRPESELLVEKAIGLARRFSMSAIAEIGTGCGAIAISLALNLPEAKIYATDISAPALEVALFNCRKHGVADRIHLRQGDMLAPLPGPVDLIAANLPYVKQPEILRAGLADFEPELALDGGEDGLEKIRQLCRQAGKRLCRQGFLLLEIGQGQGEPLTGFLGDLFPSAAVEIAPDLGGIDRVITLRLTQDCPDARLVG